MYEPRCKICNSDYRDLIEQKYHEGMSAHALSKWLLKQYGFKVSDKAIKNHMEKHFNIKEEVRKRYISQKADKPEERMKKFVEEEIDEIQELDSIMRESKELRRLAFERIKEATRARSVEVWNSTWANAAREAIRAMKMKMEKLGTTAKDELLNLLKEMWEDENVEE